MRVFAGQRDEGFYVDLGIFDLLGVGSGQVEDSTAGFNVSTLAIQVPMAQLTRSGVEAERRRAIPTPSSACGRRRAGWRCATLRAGPDRLQRRLVQVSRLGNPLVNEAVIDLARKDAFNAIEPTSRRGRARSRARSGSAEAAQPDLRRRVAAGAAPRSGDDLPDRHPRPEPAAERAAVRDAAPQHGHPARRGRRPGYDRLGVLQRRRRPASRTAAASATTCSTSCCRPPPARRR